MNHNLCRISSDVKSPDSRSNSDFIVHFNNMTCIEAINRIVIKSIDIPNVFYNISDSGYNKLDEGNSTFSFTAGGTPGSITLPTGQYSISELITLLNNNITLQGFGFVATLNDLTDKLSFTTTTPFNFLSFEDGNNMAHVLGILQSSGEVLAFNSQGFYNLGGVQEIYIASQKISDGSNMVVPDGRCIPVIAHVPLTVPFGFTEHYLTPHPELSDIEYPSIRAGSSLRTADILITDKYGNILDLGGLDVNIILKLYHDTP